MALRTGHAPLNRHLHRLGKVENPFCLHCPDTEEMVHHFLTAHMQDLAKAYADQTRQLKLQVSFFDVLLRMLNSYM